MTENYFPISSRVQEVKINPSEITTNNDGLNRFINVPIQFDLNPIDGDTSFNIPFFKAMLKSQNTNQLFSQVLIPTDIAISKEKNIRRFTAPFKLTDPIIHFIEQQRTDDLYFSIFLEVQTLIKRSPETGIGTRPISDMQFQVYDVKVSVHLPRSVWIDKLLPLLGFRNLRLIELPVTHSNLNEAYKGIVNSFDLAEKYFNAHDYNTCVAHCRTAMEKLTNSLQNIKRGNKSKTDYSWLKNVSEATYVWLDNVNKVTSAITSKAHHAGEDVNFKRHEAEAIYLVVLGMLHYVGNTDL